MVRLELIELSTLRFPSNIASLSTSSSCNFSISLKFDRYLVAHMHKAVITSSCRQQNIYQNLHPLFSIRFLLFLNFCTSILLKWVNENIQSLKQTPLSFQFGCSFPSFGSWHKRKTHKSIVYRTPCFSLSSKRKWNLVARLVSSLLQRSGKEYKLISSLICLCLPRLPFGGGGGGAAGLPRPSHSGGPHLPQHAYHGFLQSFLLFDRFLSLQCKIFFQLNN